MNATRAIDVTAEDPTEGRGLHEAGANTAHQLLTSATSFTGHREVGHQISSQG